MAQAGRPAASQEAVVIVHVVLLKVRPSVDPVRLRSFAQALTAACQEIPTVRHALVGPRRHIDAGYPRSFGETTYDYAAVLQFADEEGLQSYLNHPLHADLGRQFWEISESTVVFEGATVDLKNEPLGADWLANLEQEP